MPIIVSNKDDLIEVSIRYIDKGSKGLVIFQDKDEEEKWLEEYKEKLNNKISEYKNNGEDVPEKYKFDPKDKIRELKTWWKRTDWGTQSDIIKESQIRINDGKVDTDWSKFRMSQMKNLMVKWDLKTNKGEEIPVNEQILKRMDYNIALSLLAKYDEITSTPEDELEDLR